MNFDYKNILIMGHKKSGQAVEEIVKKLEVDYKIFDAEKKIDGAIYCSKLSKKMIAQFDLIVVSPGISVFNKYIIMAEKMGIKVVGELEFGYWFTESPVIAVTGTNGKTTTTKLIGDIVSSTYKADTFGNIGVPLSTAYNQVLDYLVCEVSSFQLETTDSFNPYISIILNIGEDHLDRHKNMDNYVKCKLGLLKNCTEKSLVVLNADDKFLIEKTKFISAKKYYISKFEKVKGVYVQNDNIYVNLSGKPQEFISVEDLNEGIGYIDNILASILVGALLKIEKEKIITALNSFKVAPHRMQLVAEAKGVKFIDDSKSTNPHSTMHALSLMRNNVILLLGGEDKKLSFDDIFLNYKEKIDVVVAFGKTRKQVLKSASKFGFKDVKSCKTFAEAVRLAYNVSKENNTVLLSPACSSFDEFASYAERGETFVNIIKELSNAEN